MTLKRYLCEARKRKLVMAKNWIDANEKFADWMTNNEIETKVKLDTKR